MFHPLHHFIQEFHIGLRCLAGRLAVRDRIALVLRIDDILIARDLRLEQVLIPVAFDHRQEGVEGRRAVLDLREEHAEQLEIRIELAALGHELVNRIGSDDRVPAGFDRDDHIVTADENRGDLVVDGRARIDEDVVVLVERADLREQLAEHRRTRNAVRRQQRVDAVEADIGVDDVDAREFIEMADEVAERLMLRTAEAVFDQRAEVIRDGLLRAVRTVAEASRKVALRVRIDDEHVLAALREQVRKRRRRGRLAHATLVVGDTDGNALVLCRSLHGSLFLLIERIDGAIQDTRLRNALALRQRAQLFRIVL